MMLVLESEYQEQLDDQRCTVERVRRLCFFRGQTVHLWRLLTSVVPSEGGRDANARMHAESQPNLVHNPQGEPLTLIMPHSARYADCLPTISNFLCRLTSAFACYAQQR
jgi:hypothetical protein